MESAIRIAIARKLLDLVIELMNFVHRRELEGDRPFTGKGPLTSEQRIYLEDLDVRVWGLLAVFEGGGLQFAVPDDGDYTPMGIKIISDWNVPCFYLEVDRKWELRMSAVHAAAVAVAYAEQPEGEGREQAGLTRSPESKMLRSTHHTVDYGLLDRMAPNRKLAGVTEEQICQLLTGNRRDAMNLLRGWQRIKQKKAESHEPA